MPRGRLSGLLNVLSALLLALTVVLAVGFLLINLNPEASFNPFRAGAGGVTDSVAELPTAFVPLLSPAQSGTPVPATATRTSQPTVTRTPPPLVADTRTPQATASPTATRRTPTTPFATLVVISTTGPSPTPTWTRSPFAFTVQGDVPFAVENVFNLAGCNWLGVGGQVYDLRGGPLIGYVVHLDGGGLNANSLSGTQPQYGPAGYEFKLAGAPKATSGVYRVQLRDPQNVPVSDWVAVDTFDDCTKNVLLVNFLQNH